MKISLYIFSFLTLLLQYGFANSFSSYPKRPAKKVYELSMPNLFTDRMVLQRDLQLRVWGWSKTNAEVKVTFAKQSKSTKANSQGEWSLLLDPLQTSFEGRTMTISSVGKTIEVKDILVGEVWICGGQSNMEWKLKSTRDSDIEIASANYDAIRYLKIPLVSTIKPQSDYIPEAGGVGTWKKCSTEENTRDCSGVAYYFGKRLHRYLRTPVGLIDTSWGGTMAQHWCGDDKLKKLDVMKSYFDRLAEIQKTWKDGGEETGAKRDHDKAMAEYNEKMKTWKKGDKRIHKPGPRKPPQARDIPGGMANAMISPISGYTTRGVLFYQGENNSFGESWKPYPETLPLAIETYRQAFGNKDLPFGMIQIAGWSTRRSMTYDQNHHCNVVREIQFDVWQKTKNTGLIVSFDTNSDNNIHPNRKEPVGERSARWALSEVYGKTYHNRPIEWRGPVFKSYEIQEDKIIVYFEPETANSMRFDQHVDAGFYIAGKDQVFHHAKAKIDSRKRAVIIWSDRVKEAAAARYAISNFPMGFLMNSKELPAYPFRTDNWPIKPHHSTGSYVRK